LHQQHFTAILYTDNQLWQSAWWLWHLQQGTHGLLTKCHWLSTSGKQTEHHLHPALPVQPSTSKSLLTTLIDVSMVASV